MLRITLFIGLSLHAASVFARSSFFDVVGRKLTDSIFGVDFNKDFGVTEEVPVVSAGEVWGEERMRRMLGMDDDIQDNEITSKSDVVGEEVPSMLVALYNKMHDPRSKVVPTRCQIPGMKGNVVRMIRNRGRILHQDQHSTIVELVFSMKNVLHEYEAVSQAHLQLFLPSLQREKGEIWSYLAKYGILSLPRYTYQIHFLNNTAHRYVKERISTKSYGGTFLSSGSLSDPLRQFLATKSFSSPIIGSGKKRSIDVTSLVEKWKRKFFSKKRIELSRAIMVVSTETEMVFMRQCLQPVLSPPKLLLVSHDKRQCPQFDEVYGVVERQKRGVTTEKPKVRSRGGKNSNRKSSLARNIDVAGGKRQGVKSRKRVSMDRSVRSSICRVHPMYVQFAEVGWGSWIIAPRGFQASRCGGECPFPLAGQLNGSNHALMMTMMDAVKPGKSIQPRCVPVDLNPLNILHFDHEGNVVFRQFQDMTVSSCGCR